LDKKNEKDEKEIITMSELEELTNKPEKLKEFMQNPEKLKAIMENPPPEIKEMVGKVNKLVKKHVLANIEVSKESKQTVSNGELWEFAQKHKDESLVSFTQFILKEKAKEQRGEKCSKILRVMWIFNDLIKSGKLKLDELKGEEK